MINWLLYNILNEGKVLQLDTLFGARCCNFIPNLLLIGCFPLALLRRPGVTPRTDAY